MKRRIVIALGVALGVTAGVVVSVSGTATSQGMGGTSAPASSVVVSGEIIAFPPDGGTEVVVTNTVRVDQPLDTNSTFVGQTAPLDSNITNTYVPIGMGPTGTPKLSAEVTGLAGAAVATTVDNVPTVALQNGTIVNLGTTSLNTLTATTGKGNCTYVDGDPTATLTTAINIPSSPLSGRTAIEIFNHSNAPTAILICSAQGTATATSGVRIESGDQSRKWEGLGAGVIVSCLCALGTCTYNYQEERCYQE